VNHRARQPSNRRARGSAPLPPRPRARRFERWTPAPAPNPQRRTATTMQLADLDHDDHPPPHGPPVRNPARLALVRPAPRTLTAPEALALVVDPRPIVAAMHLLLTPLLLAAWWGVARRGLALLVRLDDGRGAPVAGPCTLNAPPLVELLAANAPELTTDVDLRALARATDPAHPDARPWVVLEGVALGRVLVQREELHRLAVAALALGTPDGAAPRAWTARADLHRVERPSAPPLDARALVIDGGDWLAALSCIEDGPEDDATTFRMDAAHLTDVGERTAAPVAVPAVWP